jgi:hypothetical protein
VRSVIGETARQSAPDRETEKQTKETTNMRMTSIAKSIAALVLLSGFVSTASAITATAC